MLIGDNSVVVGVSGIPHGPYFVCKNEHGCLSVENKVLCSRKLLFLQWKLSPSVNMVSEVDEHSPKVRKFHP